jgi:hypothetical protein
MTRLSPAATRTVSAVPAMVPPRWNGLIPTAPRQAGEIVADHGSGRVAKLRNQRRISLRGQRPLSCHVVSREIDLRKWNRMA